MDAHRQLALSGSTADAAPSNNGQHPASSPSLTLDEFTTIGSRILASINRVMEGKADAARLALTVLLAQGHLLVEDVPGVGKTMLARTMARSIDCTVSRIQFTPDLLPSDITGVSVYDRREQRFEFRRGPVFAHVVIGDEINRASAKTQSALLECMEEHQVTVDGTSYGLGEPFMVVATQNPVDMEGTYPLPEAQRDRFMARISMGYPDPVAEAEMLHMHQSVSPLQSVEPVATVHDIRAMLHRVHSIHVSPAITDYVVRLGRATREHAHLRLGASPRALLQLLRAAKAQAALNGLDFVVPDDVVSLVEPVLSHRLIVDRRAASAGEDASSILAGILSSVPVGNQSGNFRRSV